MSICYLTENSTGNHHDIFLHYESFYFWNTFWNYAPVFTNKTGVTITKSYKLILQVSYMPDSSCLLELFLCVQRVNQVVYDYVSNMLKAILIFLFSDNQERRRKKRRKRKRNEWRRRGKRMKGVNGRRSPRGHPWLRSDLGTKVDVLKFFSSLLLLISHLKIFISQWNKCNLFYLTVTN